MKKINKKGGIKKMKKLLTVNNLYATYYDNSLYELQFEVGGKTVFIRNIREEDHEQAATDENYFESPEVLEKIIDDLSVKDKEELEDLIK